MSFLTPLYLLGGLAITLPVVFHLIRRTPKGRQVFSSLMFLQPSPPRVTKRSRIEDWLLLMLRGLVICLLAIAFARPFLRTRDQSELSQAPGRRIAILIDTSASMQRTGNWEAATEHFSRVISQLKSSDSVGLLRFDSQTEQLISFGDWLELEPNMRSATLKQQFDTLEPTSFETQLGNAMIRSAEMLEQHTDEQVTERLLYVISDFQTGSHWESLNGYQWPTGVQVEAINVDNQESPANASLQLVANESTTDDSVRLRVSNSGSSKIESFEIKWIDEFSDSQTETSSANSTRVYVPPGQSKIVRAPERPEQLIPQRLVIEGDQQDFDNVCFIARRDPWKVNIVFIGDDGTAGADSVRFFLTPLFPDTPNRDVTLLDWSTTEAAPPIDAEQITLLIVGGSVTADQSRWAQEWLADGGQVLFVATSPEQSADMYDICKLSPAKVSEADVVDYAMLRSVEFSHPVFAPFDDPKYADFSKLRFWHYRQFDLNSFPDARPLATFDSEQPAVWELAVGNGRVVAFAAGWHRSDSELAVWSKFVPVMNGLLEYLGEQRFYRPVYYVGDEVSPAEFSFRENEIHARTPQGETITFSAENSLALTHTGIFTISATKEGLTSENAVRFAVNLPPDESKTEPLSYDLLAAAGIPLASRNRDQETEEINEAAQRQLMNRELESKQQIWKWLLLAALIVLILETTLAGWRQRQKTVATTVG